MIQDLQVYIQRMQRSLLDKLFFADKIFEPIRTVLDFGCANGTLIGAMQGMFPEYVYVGYDISPEMLRMARQALPEVTFCQEWDQISVDPDTTLLNISSTIHEVYAYGDEASVSQFWDRVFGTGFKYIAIRDMMISDQIPSRADPEDVEKARKLFPEKLDRFERIWGDIGHRKNLIHYLLKYSYTENWEREVNENYLPLSVERLLALIPDTYDIVYQEHYVLPYIRHQVRKDSGITLKDATHFKLLLERKGDRRS